LITAFDFLNSLGARGLSFFSQGDRLTIAPTIALTEDDRIALWRHERALLAILRLREAAAAKELWDCPGVVPLGEVMDLWSRAGYRIQIDIRREA
jgi:hypothetical protein